MVRRSGFGVLVVLCGWGWGVSESGFFIGGLKGVVGKGSDDVLGLGNGGGSGFRFMGLVFHFGGQMECYGDLLRSGLRSIQCKEILSENVNAKVVLRSE